MFGVLGTTSGVGVYYELSESAVDETAQVERLSDEGDRSAVMARHERLFQIRDAHKRRVWPLAAGEIVLGMAMFILASRAMTGRLMARNLLVQITVAQAALLAAIYWERTEERRAFVEAKVALQHALAREQHADATTLRITSRLPGVVHGIYAVGTALRVLCNLGIVFAVTRPRCREFFDPDGVPSR